MARGRRLDGVAFHGEQGAVAGRQDQRSCLRRARWLSPPPLSQARGAKLGQDESSSSDVLEQDEAGFGCDGVYERMQEKRADSAWRVHSQGLPMMLLCSCCCS